VGASWVRQHVLVDHPGANVSVLAIWIPMQPGDERSNVNDVLIDDPRVTNYWDGDKKAGAWLADHRIGDLAEPGAVVWDAYFAFAPQATWGATPDHLVASGSDIIDTTGGLSDHFLPLLGS
jgi:hypothetical protein